MVATNFCFGTQRNMTYAPKLVEVLTGRMRPRHRRFHHALEQLCCEIGQTYQLHPATQQQRLIMHFVARWHGTRALDLDGTDTVGLLHQALNRGSMRYMAEFDVPLALHGYNIRTHRRAAADARRLMERPQLRALLVFSDWARRSFELHYGPEVGAKCRTVYPLAFEGAYCGSFRQRRYDFSFVSTGFRIKSGPEVVRAFCRVRQQLKSDARLCVVTKLSQARRLLGDLDRYDGVEWREATLTEPEIADLLADTRCLLHPSLSDSFGVVVLEALAAGCAVIASDMASFPELVGVDNGWLVRVPTATVVGDTYITEFGKVDYHEQYLNTLSFHQLEATLEKRILDFLTDRESAHAMMVASHALYERKFSPQAWRCQMLRVLSQGFPELGTLPE
jgi:glycosyltransferase involved in cell wall biosynthesis